MAPAISRSTGLFLAMAACVIALSAGVARAASPNTLNFVRQIVSAACGASRATSATPAAHRASHRCAPLPPLAHTQSSKGSTFEVAVNPSITNGDKANLILLRVSLGPCGSEWQSARSLDAATAAALPYAEALYRALLSCSARAAIFMHTHEGVDEILLATSNGVGVALAGAVSAQHHRCTQPRAICTPRAPTPALPRPRCAPLPQDGSVVNDTLATGQSFVLTRNRVHMVFNPSCTRSAKFLSFLNNFDAKVRERD